jgi:hypothetical protein
VINFVRQVKHANEKAQARNGNRPPQTGKWIAHAGGEAGGNVWCKSSENPVTDVIRQRHGTVPDPGWENLNQEGGNGTVYHRYINYLNDDE